MPSMSCYSNLLTFLLLQVQFYERLSPLVPLKKPLGSFSNIQTGDCIVTFSRHDIYKLKVSAFFDFVCSFSFWFFFHPLLVLIDVCIYSFSCVFPHVMVHPYSPWLMFIYIHSSHVWCYAVEKHVWETALHFPDSEMRIGEHTPLCSGTKDGSISYLFHIIWVLMF